MFWQHPGLHHLRKTPGIYRRTSISEKKKAQRTFPLGHFFPLKVVKYNGKAKSNSMENCPA
jgi:hypothetical protein